MELLDQVPEHVRGVAPYVPGKPITQLARELGFPVEQIVKLASNENPLGMSPKAKSAVAAAVANGLERYPDQFDLIAALASRLGVEPGQVVLGNGSNDVLDLAARVFLMPGRSAVYAQHAFAVYPIATRSAGATPIEVPAREYGHDLEGMLAAIRPDTHLVWIANPNNPTGNFLPYESIRAFLARVPRHVAVVLDEAYNEYLAPADRVDSVAWIKDFPNLIVTRTFSKVFGMAGLRVGFAVAAPAVADLLNRLRQPFNVNSLALVAALAALDDHLFLGESYALNVAGMQQLVAGFKALGLGHIPSHGNFVTFAVPDSLTGAEVNGRLLRQGVIVRPIVGYGLPQHLRVTIGTGAENQRFLDALAKALQGGC